MRSDMAKVIVERPRLGSRQKLAKGYFRRLRRIPAEELPCRESIFVLKGHTRGFNEHLGPLRRYLHSQIGRPWNLVFSEICANIRVDSAVQSHVRDHVFGYVDLQGPAVEPCGQKLFYVCPRTGLLRASPLRVHRRRARPIERVAVDATREYRLIRSLWFDVVLAPLADAPRGAWDFVLRLPVAEVYPLLALKTYGDEVYASRLRQLNKRELRKLGLTNRAVET